MKLRNLIIGLLPLSLLMTGCNDWLDIHSDNVLLEDQVFDNCTGVEMAVNGVYRDITSQDLYGRNLTWGFASALAQDYSRNSLPQYLGYAAGYMWENSDVQSTTEATWAKAYNVIANCNNIIVNIQDKDSTFFKNGQIEKDLILGEMRGIRSLLHFDMMRIFCPVPNASNGSTLAIPYVTNYPEKQPQRLTLDEVKNKIIEDMEYARTVLGPLDTEKFNDWTRQRQLRFPSGSYTPSLNNNFLNRRGVRMNYWAATGLLARIYMYCGDEQKAYDMAQSIIGLLGTSSWSDKFYWENQYSLGYSDPMLRCYNNPKRWNELMMGFWNESNIDNFESVTYQASQFLMNEMEKLFEGETDDYRYAGLYDTSSKRYTTWTRPTTTSSNYENQVNTQVQYQSPLIPIIGFMEMNHIIIEYLIDNNRLDEARTKFADIRLMRGVKNNVALPDEATELKEKFVNEMVREGLTNGQTFFMYKRLNHDILYGSTTIPMTPEKFTAEYPNNENYN